MIQAVTHSPRYVEGSAPTGFMQSIRDLIAKVQEIFMGILEKLLPCFFQKEETANPVALNPTENRPAATGQGLLEQQAAMQVLPPEVPVVGSRPATAMPNIGLNEPLPRPPEVPVVGSRPATTMPNIG